MNRERLRSGLSRLVPPPFTDMNKRSLGVVALALIAAGCLATFAIGSLDLLEHRYRMSMVLPDAAGLDSGSPIRLAGVDVGEVTSLMDIDPDLHAPPPLVFAWGQLTFTCVLTRVQQRYVLFRPDGTPVRARLTVSLSEYRNLELEAKVIKRQTVDYTKVHVVAVGDTLPLVAHREYADASAWRAIAIRNDITDPRSLPEGATLAIPRLPYVDPNGVVHEARPRQEAS